MLDSPQSLLAHPRVNGSGPTMDENEAISMFEALTTDGVERFRPFSWQMRLLHHLANGDVPAALDIPTGLGKTTVMALWLIALGSGGSLPRRLVYIVDRRAVVDQATRFAEQMRDNMPETLGAKLSLGAEGLPISTLRGGAADNRSWLEDPSRPAIIVGTIDMIGSRLLFQGYGVSKKMRPYHAGFLGVDTLVVLDEAHLCPPFESLLEAVDAKRDAKFGPTGGHTTEVVTPPFRLMSLSATGRRRINPTEGKEPFRLQRADNEDPVVRRRLNAPKGLLLDESDRKTLPQRLADRALELSQAPPARVVIFCDRRVDAVATKEIVDKAIKSRAATKLDTMSAKTELLVGERRGYEREALAAWLSAHGFLGKSAPPTAPIILVATSAGEVGVDLNADHMVCDLVSYERMVQRLGRVNRRGDGPDAIIDVFSVRPELKANARKPDRDRHEEELADHRAKEEAIASLPQRSDGRHDASPEALLRVRTEHPHKIDRATSSAPLHPPLARPHVEAWALTSLDNHAGRTKVAPWLRGWESKEEPQVAVVFRRFLPEGSRVGKPEIQLFFQLAPIHVSERLEAPHSHVWNWLTKRVRRLREAEPVAVVIDHAGELVQSVSFDDLLRLFQTKSRQAREQEEFKRNIANATLILDSSFGGLTADGMLDEKHDGDVASADDDEEWQARTERDDGDRPLIQFLVKRESNDDEALQTDPGKGWRRVHAFEIGFAEDGHAQEALAVYQWADAAHHEDSRSILSRPQTLRDHANQVARRVREMAERLEIPVEEIEALETAARLHDDGKAANRWQEAMRAPDDGRRPYAKTRGGGDWRLLEGYRHEFGSLLMAEAKPLPADMRDLILHLIAAHHGYARPLISTAGCEELPPSALESKAGAAALRFIRLQRKYGIWGLAWREAILRAADQSASRDWDRQSDANHG